MITGAVNSSEVERHGWPLSAADYLRAYHYTFNHDITCDLCKGAARHQVDHYGLGRLRGTIASDLGLNREATQQLTLLELLAKWQTFKRGITAAATKVLLDLYQELQAFVTGHRLRVSAFVPPPTEDQDEARRNPSYVMVEDLGSTMPPYEEHTLRCVGSAERWEQAAETARVAGEFELARLCTERSSRYRYLAEDDPEVQDLFNGTGRWA